MTTRILSRWTLGATIFLVALGGFTRGSGSGYGCADRWPLCENGLLGGLLPRAEFHMIVEWSHRWLAALVGVLAVATAVVAWREVRRWVAWVALAAIGVIGIQAWVGRQIVTNNIPADLVSLHLAISMTVAGLFAVVAAATTGPVAPRDSRWATRFGIGAGLALAVMILGSLVHNVYVPGWPLTLDAIIPNLDSRTIAIHFFHRVVAAVSFVFLIWLALRARTDRPTSQRYLVYAALGAFVTNIGLGAAHVFTQVGSSTLVVLHLGVASLVWVSLVAAATMAAGVEGERPLA